MREEIVVRGRAGSGDCPLCREPLGSAGVPCPGCQTPYHPECTRELGGCATLGCDRLGEPLRAGAAGYDAADPAERERFAAALAAWRAALPDRRDPFEVWLEARRRDPKGSGPARRPDAAAGGWRARGVPEPRSPGWERARALSVGLAALTQTSLVNAALVVQLRHGLESALYQQPQLWIALFLAWLACGFVVMADVAVRGGARPWASARNDGLGDSVVVLFAALLVAIPEASLLYFIGWGRRPHRD